MKKNIVLEESQVTELTEEELDLFDISGGFGKIDSQKNPNGKIDSQKNPNGIYQEPPGDL